MLYLHTGVVNISNRSPLADANFADGIDTNINYPQGVAGFIGVLAWKRGALLVSMIWVAMVVMVLDRKWKVAAIWALIGSVFAVFGIIHVPQAGFDNFNSPTMEQCACDGYPVEIDNSTTLTFCDLDSVDCWDNATQLDYFGAYLMLAATFGLIEIAKKFDDSIPEELDDPSAHAFDDWFSNAGIVAPDSEKDVDVTAKGNKELDGSVGEEPKSDEVDDDDDQEVEA